MLIYRWQRHILAHFGRFLDVAYFEHNFNIYDFFVVVVDSFGYFTPLNDQYSKFYVENSSAPKNVLYSVQYTA